MANHFQKRDHSRGTEPEAFSDPKIGEVHAQLAREKEEPSEGFSGVPIFVVFLFCALGFWGSVYLTRYAGREPFDANTYVYAKESGPVVQKERTLEEIVKNGEKLYSQNCATCHQADGKGVPGSFPPLAGSEWVHGNPARFIKIANSGIAGEITVAGQKFNGAMPNIGEGLKDEKLADLLTYVRQAWGNKGEPVDAETVKEVRAATGKRGQWSSAEILGQHPLGQ